jgi:hypothetical protein
MVTLGFTPPSLPERASRSVRPCEISTNLYWGLLGGLTWPGPYGVVPLDLPPKGVGGRWRLNSVSVTLPPLAGGARPLFILSKRVPLERSADGLS